MPLPQLPIVAVRLTDTQYHKMRKLALRERINHSELIRRALKYYALHEHNVNIPDEVFRPGPKSQY